MWRQIIAGSLVLGLCAAIHLGVLALSIGWIRFLVTQTLHWDYAALVVSFAAVLLGHTIQVWIWALFFVRRGAISNFEDAAYFALVTTTTLGYGDVTLPRHHRLFGAMGAVCGLLMFGFSTAFLIAVLRDFFPA